MKQRAYLSRSDRFWSKVDKAGPVPVHRPDLGPCWLWTAGQNAGYGQFKDGYPKNWYTSIAHRTALDLVGRKPIGPVDHLCETKLCVNPNHLEEVTFLENRLRTTIKITHCPAGHEYNKVNTRFYRNSRICRACARERQRASRKERSLNGQHTRTEFDLFIKAADHD